MNQLRNIVTGMAVAVLLVSSAAAGPKHHKQSASRTAVDSEFATKAAQTNLSEIRLADLAMTKTSNQSVKNLAQSVESGHAKANNELKDIAAKQNLTLPKTVDPKEQAEYDRLSKLSGAEFDRAYTRKQVEAHKDVIAEYRRESSHGTDPELKKYATDTLPALEHHLQLAETAHASASKESH